MTDQRYEAYTARDGYGYVDLRDAEGGTTVLGANGEGGFTPEQAERIADALNDAMDPGPAPGKLRLEASYEDMSLILGLLRGTRSHDALAEDVRSVIAAYAESDEPSFPAP